MNRAERRALGLPPAPPAPAPRAIRAPVRARSVWLAPPLPEDTALVAVRREPPKECR